MVFWVKFIKNIDSIMDPVVDFRRIARNVMGKYYKQSSSAQREEFFQVFRSTLLTTYADTFVDPLGGPWPQARSPPWHSKRCHETWPSRPWRGKWYPNPPG